MSYANGQRTGTRSNDGQQHRGQPSRPAPYPQKKPYTKAVPAKEPVQTASIFKTRAFKFLVDAVGAENIALGLDSTLPRIAELANGERFTPETAFHMEVTLGLPDGFFDQPNPALSPDTIARLKSPLKHLRDHAEVEAAYNQNEQPTVAVSTTVSPSTDNEPPEEAVMPTRKKDTSVPVVAKGRVAAAPVIKPFSANAKAQHKVTPQRSLGVHEKQTVFEIRRANLHVLTARNGSKSQLGRLLEISQSNMAHRLHGQKRMDDVESKRFTDALGLPVGWLDVPRAVTEISATVLDLLVPAGRRNGGLKGSSVGPEMTTLKVDKELPPMDRPIRKARTMQKEPSGAGAPAVTQHNNQRSKNEDQSVQEVSSVPENRVIAVPLAAPVTQDTFLSASATSLETLHGISPIAEALIKTLAGKARTGRLDEIHALQLLQQAILL